MFQHPPQPGYSEEGENRPLLLQWPNPELSDGLASQLERDAETGGDSLEKGLLRKLDRRMSILVPLILLSYIDRSNVAAARLNGFEHDLKLEGRQFATIISVLYVGYIFMQVPSNMILSQMKKPALYLSCCMIGVGLITSYIGFAQSYHDALIARLVLGFIEAPLFSGTMFFLGKWYKRHELSERLAYIFLGGFVSLAFGSLAASGILQLMDRMLGYAGWRWIFIVEGSLAILVATCALFILPDLPQATRIGWLTDAEHELARKRMIEDAPVDSSSLSDDALSGLLFAIADWKVYFLALSAFLTTIATSFVVYFPTLVATMGYSSTVTLLLCAPPWVIAAVFSLWQSRHSDKTGERCMHVITPLVIAACGFILAMSTMKTTARYASFYLMSQANVSDVCFYAWISSTVGVPPAKRAVSLAFINAVAQCANVAGSYVWVTEWGPTYNKSFAICVATCLASILLCLYLRSVLRKLNDGESGGWKFLL